MILSLISDITAIKVSLSNGGDNMKTKICKECGFIGKPITDDFSSFTMDAFIWLTTFAVTVITGIIPLIILAPIFSLFHIATFRTKKCPKCGNLDMVGLHSHRGQEILTPHKGGTQPWSENHPPTMPR